MENEQIKIILQLYEKKEKSVYEVILLFKRCFDLLESENTDDINLYLKDFYDLRKEINIRLIEYSGKLNSEWYLDLNTKNNLIDKNIDIISDLPNYFFNLYGKNNESQQPTKSSQHETLDNEIDELEKNKKEA